MILRFQCFRFISSLGSRALASTYHNNRQSSGLLPIRFVCSCQPNLCPGSCFLSRRLSFRYYRTVNFAVAFKVAHRILQDSVGCPFPFLQLSLHHADFRSTALPYITFLVCALHVFPFLTKLKVLRFIFLLHSFLLRLLFDLEHFQIDTETFSIRFFFFRGAPSITTSKLIKSFPLDIKKCYNVPSWYDRVRKSGFNVRRVPHCRHIYHNVRNARR